MLIKTIFVAKYCNYLATHVVIIHKCYVIIARFVSSIHVIFQRAQLLYIERYEIMIDASLKPNFYICNKDVI